MPSACHKTVWSRAVLIRNRTATAVVLLEHRCGESTHTRQRLSTRKNGQPWKIKVSFRNMYKRTLLAMACRDRQRSMLCSVTLWHGSNCVSDGNFAGCSAASHTTLLFKLNGTRLRHRSEVAVVSGAAAWAIVLCCDNVRSRRRHNDYQHCARLDRVFEDWKRLKTDLKTELKTELRLKDSKSKNSQ